MQVKVSKTFAKYVNQFVQETGLAEEAAYREVSPINYPGGAREAVFNGDTTPKGKCKVIEVFYKASDYACPTTLTTGYLISESHRRNIKTEADLKEMLEDLIAI